MGFGKCGGTGKNMIWGKNRLNLRKTGWILGKTNILKKMRLIWRKTRWIWEEYDGFGKTGGFGDNRGFGENMVGLGKIQVDLRKIVNFGENYGGFLKNVDL